MYGKVARQSDENSMRAATIALGSLRPAVDINVRRKVDLGRLGLLMKQLQMILHGAEMLKLLCNNLLLVLM